MSDRSGLSRGDRNRNARLARLRRLLPPEHAIGERPEFLGLDAVQQGVVLGGAVLHAGERNDVSHAELLGTRGRDVATIPTGRV